MITHYGNQNNKRKSSPCGAVKDPTDSIYPEKVSCITCIELLLRRQTNCVKNEVDWQKRLEVLKKEKTA